VIEYKTVCAAVEGRKDLVDTEISRYIEGVLIRREREKERERERG